MEEKKLTDEEIVRDVISHKNAAETYGFVQITGKQMSIWLDLIRRLQGEIERLTGTVKVLEFADRCGRRMRALDMKENAELQKRLDDLSTEENDGFLFFSQRMKLGEICEAYFKEHRILNCAQSVIGHLMRLGLLNIPKTKQYLQEQSNEKKK